VAKFRAKQRISVISRALRECSRLRAFTFARSAKRALLAHKARRECVKSVRQERIKRVLNSGTEEKNLPICLSYLVFTENDYLSFA
jgi:hypothetical protein